MNTELQKAAKTFWDRPEGKTGMLFLAAAIAAGGWVLWKILPTLILLLENTLYAGLLGLALFLLTSPLWSTQVRTILTYMFRSVCRGITGWFVEIDPIGILKSYLEDMRKSMAQMQAQIENLRGHINRLKTLITKNQQDAEQSLKLAGAAKSSGQKAAMVVNVRKAGRLEKSNVTLSELLTRMEKLYGFLNKLFELTDIKVQDMESEIQVREQEHKAITAGYGAFTSALKVLKGDPDKRALFDQAMDHLAEDYAQKAGEIEHFMEASKGVIASMDLENGIIEEDALRKLDALEAQAENLMLGPPDAELMVPRSLGEDDRLRRNAAQASSVQALFTKGK